MKNFTLFLLSLFVISASAKDFSYKGITYTVLDENSKTVETKAGYAEKIDDKTNYIPGNNVTGKVSIPETVYDGDKEYTVERIGDYAFASCVTLADMSLPESITEIGEYAFLECLFLDSIVIPNSVTSIGDFAFFGCMSMKSVSLSESLKTIPAACFSVCIELTEISFPESITGIGSAAFMGCMKLKEVTIPDKVLVIGGMAFMSCEALNTVWLPESLFLIGQNIFDGCKILKSIYYPIKSYTAIGYDDSFDDTIYKNTTLFVPQEMVEKCKESSPWNKFENIKEYNFSGLSDIVEDDLQPIYYDLSGNMINNPSKGQIVIERKGNKTRKIVF